MKICPAHINDLFKILELQKISFLQEARLYDNYSIQPLIQTMEEIKTEFETKIFLKVESGDVIIGSVRAHMDGEDCWVNKLMVHPDYQGQGIGQVLLLEIEKYFPRVKRFKLGTGAKSKNNIRLYEKAGYKIMNFDKFHDGVEAVLMEKIID
jgi:GNAT superfamily N-acetyltransferase